MGTIPFQLGLDIATALSVLGAAWAFIYNSIKIRSEREKEEAKKLEDRVTSEAIDRLGRFFETYSRCYIEWAGRVRENKEKNPNIIFQEIEIHLPYIKGVVGSLFKVYGMKDHERVVIEISMELYAWNKKCIKAFEEQNPELFEPSVPLNILIKGIEKLAALKRMHM